MSLFLVQTQTFKIGQMKEQAKKMRTFALQIINSVFAS
jgi:hypothetical protein